jgi:PKD repeat protein
VNRKGKRVRRGHVIVGSVAASLLALAAVPLSSAYSSTNPAPYLMHEATGVGSCTLKGWNPNTVEPEDITNSPVLAGNIIPDNFDCSGARFAGPGVEFAKFPQPHDFKIQNKVVTQSVLLPSGKTKTTTVWQPTKPLTVTSPYFPPFTHFVIIYRENHTFDDYLGDCATTVHAGCNGEVMTPNHISSVPELHTLAKTYALDDAYSTGVEPPSGPNHWFLFSGQSASSSQQQSYPTAGGTEFDRFLHGDTIPAQGTSACTGQTTNAGTGSSPYTFVMNGDFYWMLNSGSGYFKNPTDGDAEVLPIDRPGTDIPEEVNYNQYTCQNVSVSDTQVASGFTSFVKTNGLPAYSYVELFNDHPGSAQDIPQNDTETGVVVNSIMTNPTYENNTLIIVTEDDTQNGANGPDHVSNTYRVPLVVIGSSKYVKQGYLSHVAYNTSNVIAAMERVMENVKPGIINPTGALGLTTFPMTTADQSALGDPLEDFWIQGSTPLSATASASVTTGNAPLATTFTGSATGGTAPYTYSWNFGDGSATSTAQDPSHTYTAAGTYNATLTVTDSASPANTATSTVQITVNAVGGNLTATASGLPTSGQIPLTTNFTGTATGGTPPYSYSWNFGDGSATSTAQDPSHTYTVAGTYTATLTVADSSSPTESVSASVPITASPIMGTVPSAPQSLAATAGNGKITLTWAAPANDGGEAITAYEIFRGTSSGTETYLTSGGCSNLAAVLTCTDSGLTNGTTYYYYAIAANSIGTGPQSNETSATPTGSTGCTSAQLLGNPGFETGTAPWSATPGVVHKGTTPGTTGARKGKTEPAHSGSYDAWLDGYGTTHTDTLSQAVTLPTGCSTYTLSFWMHIDTAETTTTSKYDTLSLQLLSSSGTVLKTLYTYSNLNHNTGYTQHTFNLAAYAGQSVKLEFTGKEDYELQTSFVIDDTALNVAP